jgi:two-component system chemotaxis sensor kinase CheA
VLVVDDQITIRELQRSILGAAGYDVLTARDGREALDALERAPDVQLVLTDVEMPVLDGFGLLEQIRAHPVHASLPVIIVSSRGDEADRRRGAEAGADAYVVKSEFDQRSLLATVQRLVGVR